MLNIRVRSLRRDELEKAVFVEVDEGEKKLLEALRSLGFEVYETEFHMRRFVP